MELKIIHFYPDLMSLYGSYANVSVLRRYLEALGCAVTVQAVVPGEGADITGADFLFMGAGTERAQRFAAEDFARYSAAVKAAAQGKASPQPSTVTPGRSRPFQRASAARHSDPSRGSSSSPAPERALASVKMVSCVVLIPPGPWMPP